MSQAQHRSMYYLQVLSIYSYRLGVGNIKYTYLKRMNLSAEKNTHRYSYHIFIANFYNYNFRIQYIIIILD